VVRADSGFYNQKVIAACTTAGVDYSVTTKMSKPLRDAIAKITDQDWTAIPYFLADGADVAEIDYQAFAKSKNAPGGVKTRLIVRRVRPTPGSQLALFVTWSYHAFITNRTGTVAALEADHRRHAVVENTIRDLKYGVGLNHLPSGRFGANAAWLTLNVIAHNMAAWTARLGGLDTTDVTSDHPGDDEPTRGPARRRRSFVATDTLRRRYLHIPGRITTSGRQRTPSPADKLAVATRLRPDPRHAANHHPHHVLTQHQATPQPPAGPADDHPAPRTSGPSRPETDPWPPTVSITPA